MSQGQYLLLFDGVCNLCNGFIQFVIERDKKKRFLFAPLQSNAGRDHLQKFGKSETEFDSVVIVVGEKVLEKSTAVLYVIKNLGGLWSLAYVFIIIPRFIRDWAYDIVASNRYTWFGKRQECMIPTPELKERFLD